MTDLLVTEEKGSTVARETVESVRAEYEDEIKRLKKENGEVKADNEAVFKRVNDLENERASLKQELIANQAKLGTLAKSISHMTQALDFAVSIEAGTINVRIRGERDE